MMTDHGPMIRDKNEILELKVLLIYFHEIVKYHVPDRSDDKFLKMMKRAEKALEPEGSTDLNDYEDVPIQ